MNAAQRLILVTGATGYIGGRLVGRLLERGFRVRCLVRDPSRLEGRPWHYQVEVVVGDMLEPAKLPLAMHGVHAAYYLIHSMGSGGDYPQRDLRAAKNFGAAAKASGVERIIYLGGLAEEGVNLSRHLRSRLQTGEALRGCGCSVTEFRAAVIVGSGGLSFEMIRYLTERMPIIVCPRWVSTRTQPIGLRNVLEYLVSALDVPESAGQIIEIGGSDVISYADMMMTYARVRGLKRRLLPLPVLTPRLFSYWVSIVTPIPAAIARPLIDGLRNENIVRCPTARRIFPHIQPMGYLTAVERALMRLEASEVETAWSDALVSSQGDIRPVILSTQKGIILEQRQRLVPASPEAIFKVFTGIGGGRGWFYMNWAWVIRGWIDRLVGGVGLRRGRRDPDELRVGDALDFWRVEALEPGRSLRLRAEMKLPGTAWMQFQVSGQKDGRSLLQQTAFFAPKGLSGQLYWNGLYPLHGLIFSGLIDEITRRAVAQVGVKI